MPGSKVRQKKPKPFVIDFAEKYFGAIIMQSFEFLRQVRQIEMVVIGFVIDG